MEWDRQGQETARAYEWFCRYRDYGPERSLLKVCQKYTGNLGLLKRWSAANNWVERTEAYDLHLEKQKRFEREDEILAAARKHAKTANMILDRACARLESLDPEDLSPKDLLQYIDTAIKIEREALGIAAKQEISQVVHIENNLADELIRRSRELLEQ